MYQPKQVIIYAPDFKPIVGGVAEYTFHLADSLHQAGLLDSVVTPVPQDELYNFPVFAPKKRNLIKGKLHSLLYLAERYWIKRSTLLKLQNNPHSLVIINWLESPLSYDFIKNCHQLNLKYGLILHGKEIITSSRKNYDEFHKICRKANLLVFNSKATANLWEKVTSQVPPASYILRPGINCSKLDKFDLLSKEQLENKLGFSLQDKTVVCTVSRLVQRKGIDLALKAIAPLIHNNPKLIYLIGGNGEEYYTLQELIQKLEINHQVYLLGSISEVEKYSILKTSSIFLMPNHDNQGTDFEGFGISFIEASYFKNVVIGGRSGGAVEAIAENLSGFLVDANYPSAVEQIRKYLDYLINHSVERHRIAELGSNYVVENFQVPKLINDFTNYLSIQLYQNNI